MYRGNYSIAKLLLQAFADVTATYSNSWTLFHIAVLGAQEHILSLLVEYGADIEPRSASNEIGQTEGGMTAMHFAVDSEEKGIVRRLIETGADINAKEDGGRTPRHYALVEYAELGHHHTAPQGRRSA